MEPIRVHFPGSGAFHMELKRRVDAYFEGRGLSPKDSLAMYAKTVAIFGWTAGCYLVLLLAPLAWWQVGLVGAGLALGMAGIGFSIQHDANHGGYSRSRWVNRMLSYGLDLIGGSSYVWYYKHNIVHHTYTNVSGIDIDIDIQPFLRLAPDQPWRPHYRWQTLYIWFLYGLLPFNWHFHADYRDLIQGTIGDMPFPRPTKLGLAFTLAGKIFFYSWSVVIPMFLHPWWGVIVTHLLVSWMLGMLLTTTFQMAHCLHEAEVVTLADAREKTLETAWAEHQVRTTANFAPRNPFLTWYLGGLNYQIEHHLFPKVCHIHYPKLSPIVAETCRDFGIPYETHPTLWRALASHLSYVRMLSRKPEPAAVPV